MKRDLNKLSSHHYDLCVIGGGIYGACVAWDAVLRGLSVALVEKNDFASATSANSLKIIHGGLRYLQHLDFKRMRESIREQGILMRIAPHLVHPLPVIIPTYGYGLQSKWAFTWALAVNNLVGFDRNYSTDPQKKRPRAHVISTKECLQRIPDIDSKGVTGGAIFYDAQVHNSERLVLSFLHSAANRGADLANYCKVTEFIHEQDRVVGVKVTDQFTCDVFSIRSNTVVNTTGPWINDLSSQVKGCSHQKKVRFIKAINLVTRPLFQNYAVGLPGQERYHDSDAVINKGNRMLFVAPWRDVSIIGTSYLTYDNEADEFNVSKKEVEDFLGVINKVCPKNTLALNDVTFVHGGLLPSDGFSKTTGDIRMTKHYEIYDHQAKGIKGMISVVGVKYTTARFVAEKVVDRIVKMIGGKKMPSTSANIPLHGGRIDRFEPFMTSALKKETTAFGKASIQKLVYNYGSVYSKVVNYLPKDKPLSDACEKDVLEAETLYGIHEEMAFKLSDIVFRRTELGTTGNPGHERLKVCGEVMAKSFGWSQEKLNREYQEVTSRFFHPFQSTDGGETDVRADLAHSIVQ